MLQVDKQLTVYNASTGKQKATFEVEDYDITEVDVEGRYAVYDDRDDIVLVRLSDGRRTTFRHVDGIEEVQLEPEGMYYSWDDPKAKEKSWRVTFVPASKLPR